MNASSSPGSRRLINLGCGGFVSQTRWVDYDGSWNVFASRLPMGLGWLVRQLMEHKSGGFPRHVHYVNVTKRLPFADGTIDAIYFSHVLEHLHLEEGRRLLSECRRVLKPGGLIRVLVPDTEHILDGYYADRSVGKNDACLILNQRLWYRPLAVKGGFLRRLYVAATDFHSHKFMYDRAYLRVCLEQAGFGAIEEVHFNASRIPEIADVEIKDRIDNGHGFGFEAVRVE